MTPNEQSHDNTRREMAVLLLIIGGLGDWCIRRVLKHALEFEAGAGGRVTVAVVDVHPPRRFREAFDHWLVVIDQWIVRRLLEQTAEEVDQPLRDAQGAALKGHDWGFTGRLSRHPKLPDPTEVGSRGPDHAIAEFLNRLGPVFQDAYREDRESLRNDVEGRMGTYFAEIREAVSIDTAQILAALARRWRFNGKFTTVLEIEEAMVYSVVDQLVRLAEKVRQRLFEERVILKEWLGASISISGEEVHRYWRLDSTKNKLFRCAAKSGTVEAVDEARLRSLVQEYRIIVYAATPPDTYPGILRQWSSFAERIAFEKPIAGLLQSVD